MQLDSPRSEKRAVGSAWRGCGRWTATATGLRELAVAAVGRRRLVGLFVNGVCARACKGPGRDRQAETDKPTQRRGRGAAGLV